MRYTFNTSSAKRKREDEEEKKKNKECKLWSAYTPRPEFQINHLLAAQIRDESPLWIPSLCPVEIKTRPFLLGWLDRLGKRSSKVVTVEEQKLLLSDSRTHLVFSSQRSSGHEPVLPLPASHSADRG